MLRRSQARPRRKWAEYVSERLRPYVEGLAGLKYLSARTPAGEDDLGGNVGEEVAGSTH